MCRAQSFDLIIVDVMMPRVDGIELIVALHAEKNQTPIIVITGIAGDFQSYAMAAESIGARCILPKPFKTEVLIAAVDEALQSL